MSEEEEEEKEEARRPRWEQRDSSYLLPPAALTRDERQTERKKEKRENKQSDDPQVKVLDAKLRELRTVTVGTPSLPVLLQLLTAQTRRLVDAEEAQNLLHCLGVSVVHR